MKYSQTLANRVQEILVDCLIIEEKEMFGRMAFMVEDKLCICIQQDGLLLRIDPKLYNELLEKDGCRKIQMGNRIMKGYVHVEETALQTIKAFSYWIELALNYNKQAKSAKKQR